MVLVVRDHAPKVFLGRLLQFRCVEDQLGMPKWRPLHPTRRVLGAQRRQYANPIGRCRIVGLIVELKPPLARSAFDVVPDDEHPSYRQPDLFHPPKVHLDFLPRVAWIKEYLRSDSHVDGTAASESNGPATVGSFAAAAACSPVSGVSSRAVRVVKWMFLIVLFIGRFFFTRKMEDILSCGLWHLANPPVPDYVTPDTVLQMVGILTLGWLFILLPNCC